MTMAATRKGQFASSSGDGKAHVEKEFLISFNGDSYHQTIRTSSCSLLVKQGQCSVCKAYRSQLRAMYSRWSKRAVTAQKYANNRYLNTPQKQKKLETLQAHACAAEKEVKKLQERIKKNTEQNGVQLPISLNEDLLTIMTESKTHIEEHFPEGSFRRLFWEQQFQAAKLKDAR